VVLPFDHDRLSGNELALAMTITVPRDQLTAERPDVEIDAPRIERRA
jgi:hypothetical protein